MGHQLGLQLGPKRGSKRDPETIFIVEMVRETHKTIGVEGGNAQTLKTIPKTVRTIPPPKCP